MTGVAEKGKNDFVRVAFEEAIQAICHFVTVYHLWVNQGQKLIRSKTESGDQLLEIAVVSENPRQVTVSLIISVFTSLR